MTEEKRKEDFRQFIRGLAQAAYATNRALVVVGASVAAWLQKHQEEIEAAQAVIAEAASSVQTWVKEHEDELRALNAAVEEAGGGKQLVEQLLEQLEQVPESFKQGDYEIALMVIRFSEMIDLVTDDADELHKKLYEYSTQPDLHDWMLKMYDRTGLRQARRSQLEEALELHVEGQFWGSVPILIAAFEGVVTDALIEAGLAVKYKGRIYPTDANGERKKQARPLSGIHPKLGAAKDATSDPAEVDTKQLQKSGDESPAADDNRFKRLQSIEFTYGEPGSELNNVRNAILHGEDLGYATEKRSTQFVFSLYAVLEELVFGGILDEREEVVDLAEV